MAQNRCQWCVFVDAVMKMFSIKDEERVDQLKNCQLLTEVTASISY